MISVSILSIVFLVITIGMLLAWTHFILVSSDDENDELLTSLKCKFGADDRNITKSSSKIRSKSSIPLTREKSWSKESNNRRPISSPSFEQIYKSSSADSLERKPEKRYKASKLNSSSKSRSSSSAKKLSKSYLYDNEEYIEKPWKESTSRKRQSRSPVKEGTTCAEEDENKRKFTIRASGGGSNTKISTDYCPFFGKSKNRTKSFCKKDKNEEIFYNSQNRSYASKQSSTSNLNTNEKEPNSNQYTSSTDKTLSKYYTYENHSDTNNPDQNVTHCTSSSEQHFHSSNVTFTSVVHDARTAKEKREKTPTYSKIYKNKEKFRSSIERSPGNSIVSDQKLARGLRKSQNNQESDSRKSYIDENSLNQTSNSSLNPAITDSRIIHQARSRTKRSDEENCEVTRNCKDWLAKHRSRSSLTKTIENVEKISLNTSFGDTYSSSKCSPCQSTDKSSVYRFYVENSSLNSIQTNFCRSSIGSNSENQDNPKNQKLYLNSQKSNKDKSKSNENRDLSMQKISSEVWYSVSYCDEIKSNNATSNSPKRSTSSIEISSQVTKYPSKIGSIHKNSSKKIDVENPLRSSSSAVFFHSCHTVSESSIHHKKGSGTFLEIFEKDKYNSTIKRKSLERNKSRIPKSISKNRNNPSRNLNATGKFNSCRNSKEKLFKTYKKRSRSNTTMRMPSSVGGSTICRSSSRPCVEKPKNQKKYDNNESDIKRSTKLSSTPKSGFNMYDNGKPPNQNFTVQSCYDTEIPRKNIEETLFSKKPIFSFTKAEPVKSIEKISTFSSNGFSYLSKISLDSSIQKDSGLASPSFDETEKTVKSIETKMEISCKNFEANKEQENSEKKDSFDSSLPSLATSTNDQWSCNTNDTTQNSLKNNSEIKIDKNSSICLPMSPSGYLKKIQSFSELTKKLEETLQLRRAMSHEIWNSPSKNSSSKDFTGENSSLISTADNLDSKTIKKHDSTQTKRPRSRKQRKRSPNTNVLQTTLNYPSDIKFNPPNLVMPKLNLLAVSNNLKKSRHLMKELIEETKTIYVDDKNTIKKEKNNISVSADQSERICGANIAKNNKMNDLGPVKVENITKEYESLNPFSASVSNALQKRRDTLMQELADEIHTFKENSIMHSEVDTNKKENINQDQNIKEPKLLIQTFPESVTTKNAQTKFNNRILVRAPCPIITPSYNNRSLNNSRLLTAVTISPATLDQNMLSRNHSINQNSLKGTGNLKQQNDLHILSTPNPVGGDQPMLNRSPKQEIDQHLLRRAQGPMHQDHQGDYHIFGRDSPMHVDYNILPRVGSPIQTNNHILSRENPPPIDTPMGNRPRSPTQIDKISLPRVGSPVQLDARVLVRASSPTSFDSHRSSYNRAFSPIRSQFTQTKDNSRDNTTGPRWRINPELKKFQPSSNERNNSSNRWPASPTSLSSSNQNSDTGMWYSPPPQIKGESSYLNRTPNPSPYPNIQRQENMRRVNLGLTSRSNNR